MRESKEVKHDGGRSSRLGVSPSYQDPWQQQQRRMYVPVAETNKHILTHSLGSGGPAMLSATPLLVSPITVRGRKLAPGTDEPHRGRGVAGAAMDTHTRVKF